MDENAARKILWIRAIDACDEERVILTGETLAKCAETPEDASQPAALRHPRHAARLYEAIAEAHPSLRELDLRFRWPLWLSLGILLAAFISGVGADTLGASGRIDIIAFPLLGLLLWNVAVYVFLLARWGGARKRGTPLQKSRLAAWGLVNVLKILPWPEFSDEDPEKKKATIWRSIGGAFAGPWLKLERPILHERFRLLLHLAALAAVAGTVASMYLKGLSFEYRAGWGSTFLEPEDLRRWLGVVLGPAAELTRIPLPGAEALNELRWSVNAEGELAGRWIHLYAATAGLVLFPRVVLAVMAAWRLRMEARNVSVEQLDRPLLGPREAAPAAPESLERVCVIPFNHVCASVFRERLRAALFDRDSERRRMDYLDRVNYGLEAEYAEGLDVDRLKCRTLLVVFNLSSTPEEEVQGLFLDRLSQISRQSERHADIEVWLDESFFAQRFRRDTGFSERLKQRRAAWRRMLAKREMEPHFIDVVTEEFLAKESDE